MQFHPRRTPSAAPLALAAAVSVCLSAAAAAQASGEGASPVRATAAAAVGAAVKAPGGWEVEWTPYLWVSGLVGDVGIRGESAHLDLSFRDLIKNVDGALYLPVEMRKGRWGTGIELMIVRLSDQGGTPGPLFDEVQVSADQAVVELSLRYRPVAGPSPVAVDLLAGGRLWQLSNQLLFSSADGRQLRREAGDSWVDPLIGARVIASLGGRWSFLGRGDLGGFGVGSDFTWQLLGGLGYQVAESVTLRAGYRRLDVDFENKATGFLYDVSTSGWITGVSVRP